VIIRKYCFALGSIKLGAGVFYVLLGIIIHTKTKPVKSWNATKPKFSGNGATATTQVEKIIHMTASQKTTNLSAIFISHPMPLCLK
jgi:predicted transporter